MTHKAFIWVAIAYVCLAVGMIVSLYLFSKQADDIKEVNKHLVSAAVGYCQAVIAPDDKETVIIDQLSRGKTVPFNELDPICQRVAARLSHDK